MRLRRLLGSVGRRLGRYGVLRVGRRVGLSTPVVGALLIFLLAFIAVFMA